jgi:hypothetical protein
VVVVVVGVVALVVVVLIVVMVVVAVVVVLAVVVVVVVAVGGMLNYPAMETYKGLHKDSSCLLLLYRYCTDYPQRLSCVFLSPFH